MHLRRLPLDQVDEFADVLEGAHVLDAESGAERLLHSNDHIDVGERIPGRDIGRGQALGDDKRVVVEHVTKYGRQTGDDFYIVHSNPSTPPLRAPPGSRLSLRRAAQLRWPRRTAPHIDHIAYGYCACSRAHWPHRAAVADDTVLSTCLQSQGEGRLDRSFRSARTTTA